MGIVKAGTVLLLSCGVASWGCSDEAPPRPQLVVVVDTNAPIVGQLASDPDISRAAAIDTLRIDIIDDKGQPYEFRDFVAPDMLDWPVSFGVAAENADGRVVRLRIRGFRGKLGTPGVLRDVTTIEPRGEVSIDRLVEIPLPRDGVRRVKVLLDADCVGVPSKFTEPRATCISVSDKRGDPREGLIALGEGSSPSTQVGTWAHGRSRPCVGQGPGSSICIPGGYSILGDPVLEGVTSATMEDAVPLRPVLLDPLWMDLVEVTVGRYRALVNQGGLSEPPPEQPLNSDHILKYCTWLGPDDPTHDDLPLNCLGWSSAREVCERLGGSLPTEAQWEHAARGRGESRVYPWGDTEASCCTASLARKSHPSIYATCQDQGSGLEAVGSHADASACAGPIDVSRDGVLDLAGSLSEYMLDSFRPYDHPCWAIGVSPNPMCEDSATQLRSARGGSWSAGLANAISALRTWGNSSTEVGFRCVYADGDGVP